MERIRVNEERESDMTINIKAVPCTPDEIRRVASMLEGKDGMRQAHDWLMVKARFIELKDESQKRFHGGNDDGK